MAPATVKEAIDSIANEETRRKISEYLNNLEEIAGKDPLTGLINRRMFEEHTKYLIQGYEKRLREHQPIKGVACLYIDIDNFKEYQDNHERKHDAGDELLIKVAESLQDTLRTYDNLFLARWGGDEFVSAISNASIDEGYVVGSRVRSDFNENFQKWILNNEVKEYPVTLSIGVSHFNKISNNLNDLISKADQAMYTAKESGKNKVKLYSD